MRVRGLILSLLIPGAWGRDGFFSKVSSLLTSPTTTGGTPSLNLVDQAIVQATTSDNAGVATAGQVANVVVNAPLISSATTSMASSSLGTELASAKTTVIQALSVTTDLNSCSTSAKGNEAAIQDAYDVIMASPTSGEVVQTASTFKTAMSYANGDAASKSTMYQLLVVYLDKKANVDNNQLSSEQVKAYNTITTECDKAFTEMSNVVDESRAGVDFLYSNGTGDCKNYANKDTAGLVNITLCTTETNFLSGGQWFTKLTGIFTNYGDNLCNVTFFINNLEHAISKTPEWLPHSATAYPYGIPPGVGFGLAATTPIDVTTSLDLPTIDILSTFALCPESTAPVAPASTTPPILTQTPTPTKTRDQDMYNDVANSERNCFLTEACANLVAPFERNQCEALRQVFLSSCHVCGASVVTSAQSECLKTCSSKYCMPKVAVKTTSAAGTLQVTSSIALIITMAVVGLYTQWAA